MTDRQRSASAGETRTLVFTTEAMRDVDRVAAERYHIPSIVLMENAARSIAEHIAAHHPLPAVSVAPLAIVCGPGNNGGDGLALARHLHNQARPLTIITLKPFGDFRGDAATNARITQAMNLPAIDASRKPAQASHAIAHAPLIIDALFGSGLARPITPPASDLVAAMNTASDRGAPVIAIDIPSGLDADTGLPVGGPHAPCVRAATTVTLAGMKRGLIQPHSRAWVGKIVLGEIGVPRELLREFAQAPPSAISPRSEPQQGGQPKE